MRSSSLIRGTLCANFVNCVFGMCLPAMVNYKETGILDLTYSHACTTINRLESWEYILYGVTSLPSTIAIACYFIAGTIVYCTNNSIHISKAIVIAIAVFSCSTSAYFVFDPYWLVHFYNQIKYDQLYFIVPSFYVYLASVKSHVAKKSPMTALSSNTHRMLMILEESPSEIEIVEKDGLDSSIRSKLDLDASGSGLTPGLTLLEADPSFTFNRYS